MPKLAIVTGASGNMGQAVVKKFLDEGYQVVGTIVPGDPVALDISHSQFEKVMVDLMNETASEKFVNDIFDKYKTIDATILTVGGFAMGKIADTSSADILKQVTLNFETAYHVARPVFSKMLVQKSGKIFLVGSRPGLSSKDGKGMIAYGLSKSLIFRLAELMNDEAKGTAVVTSVLVPSTIDTPQNRKSMPNADFSSWVTPEAVAAAIYFYCTDGAAALREPVIKLYNNS
jgi:NAD(P)-dependent dehydrogenase (short-subunit alcohol dehydrogenase family)